MRRKITTTERSNCAQSDTSLHVRKKESLYCVIHRAYVKKEREFMEQPITNRGQKDQPSISIEGLQIPEAKTDYPEEPPELAGTSISTKVHYSLRFTGWPNLSQLVTIAVASAGYTAL